MTIWSENETKSEREDFFPNHHLVFGFEIWNHSNFALEIHHGNNKAVLRKFLGYDGSHFLTNKWSSKKSWKILEKSWKIMESYVFKKFWKQNIFPSSFHSITCHPVSHFLIAYRNPIEKVWRMFSGFKASPTLHQRSIMEVFSS